METINEGYWVKIQDGVVVACTDTAPTEDGWLPAVEVIPEVIPNREGITTHSFDITSNPVRIVWDKRAVEVSERKDMLVVDAKNTFLKVVQSQMDLQLSTDPTEEFDTPTVQTAKEALLARIAVIEATSTHEEVDAIL